MRKKRRARPEAGFLFIKSRRPAELDTDRREPARRRSAGDFDIKNYPAVASRNCFSFAARNIKFVEITFCAAGAVIERAPLCRGPRLVFERREGKFRRSGRADKNLSNSSATWRDRAKRFAGRDPRKIGDFGRTLAACERPPGD